MNMKRKIRGTLVLFMVLSILLIQVSAVFAYATFGGHILTNGVHNRYTWYDSTQIDITLHNYIISARNDWNNTATHVWFIETTNKPSSVMDIYHQSLYPASQGIFAETWFYVGSTQIDPSTQNWGWCRIYLNSPSFDSLPTSALVSDANGNSWYINRKKSVIAHEMGHVFGLDHVWGSAAMYNLMYPYGDVCKVDWPTQDEINGVNYLYP